MSENKKPEDKLQEKKSQDKKPQEKKSQNKKPQEKKSQNKKPQEKKSQNKKSQNKKPQVKKQKNKKKNKKKKEVSTLVIQKPDYVDYRIKKFEEFYKKEQEANLKKSKEITVTLPDGTKKKGKSFITTPFDIAVSISVALSQKVITSEVNGKVWDLGKPLVGDCSLNLLKWDSPKAQEVFWHSSSHVLGRAIEHAYQGLLCKGPPLKDGGFYYESYMKDKSVSEKDFKKMEELANELIKKKQKFQMISISKDEALELFKYNKFKTEILAEKVPKGGICTVYRCGDLVDPCKGPHVLDTGRIKTFWVTKNSSSYWRANAENESLQRVYAISFPNKKLMKEYKHLVKEAEKRDHRIIGKKQELWTFYPEIAPGMVFMLPHGQRIFNTLVNKIKAEYWKRGFQEVQTPNIFNSSLFKTSGHWKNYKDDMFVLKVDEQEHSLKPMNCPGHCMLFRFRNRSYKELPIRFADFGVLHRNELKGTLTGMTRVRRFQQDDAHIFCRSDQIKEEIKSCLTFLSDVYALFGFTFKLNLSTRNPKKFMGEIKDWELAEEQLKLALDSFGQPWKLQPGEGAFYGPKIDITMSDALKREHQCGTIQLDFQLPKNFNLEYSNTETTGKRTSRPVMIHRAIYGSLERFMAILCEHYAGKWPFWISPRQIIVLPISQSNIPYAKEVCKQLRVVGLFADVDESRNGIKKKIKLAQMAQYNYMLCVGGKEESAGSVNLRKREDGQKTLGEKSIPEVIAYFQDLIKNHK